jgi:AcrR family transcriptional regulator
MAAKRIDGVKTRQALLEAAGQVFASKGFKDATIAEISGKARTNMASVNYYYGSKEELYAEAWRYAFERSIEAYPPDGGVPANAPAEKRLRGQIHSLVHRMTDSGTIDLDIAHKEMANPTGLLSEVMHRSIEPLHQAFTAIVRELLGKSASEKQVQLCEMSIHTQCFAPLMHERQRKAFVASGKPAGPPPPAIEPEMLAEHVYRFSIAGIRGLRGQPDTAKEQKDSRRMTKRKN